MGCLRPLRFPKARAAFMADQCHTIGEFYAAVSDLITDLGPDVFTGHRSRQVRGWIGSHEITAVSDPGPAQQAITLIVDQGEGTTTSSASNPDELAHYYRFEQIQKGETLSPDAEAAEGYHWGDPVVPLDDEGVWPMVDNPRLVPLPSGSDAAVLADQFDGTYPTLADELQATVDGNPALLGSAVAQMTALRLQAQRMMREPLPGSDAETIGPRFVYRGVHPGHAVMGH